MPKFSSPTDNIEAMAEYLFSQRQFRSEMTRIAGCKLSVKDMYRMAEERAPIMLACPWCVVLNPDTSTPEVDAQHDSLAGALRAAAKIRQAGFVAVVMKRLPNGSLTTEF